MSLYTNCRKYAPWQQASLLSVVVVVVWCLLIARQSVQATTTTDSHSNRFHQLGSHMPHSRPDPFEISATSDHVHVVDLSTPVTTSSTDPSMHFAATAHGGGDRQHEPAGSSVVMVDIASHADDSNACQSASHSNAAPQQALIVAWLPQIWMRGQRIYDWLTNALLARVDRAIEVVPEFDHTRMTRDAVQRTLLVTFLPLLNLQSLSLQHTFGVYHMADEYCQQDASFAWYKHVRYVLRNYYCMPERWPEHVLWVPIGWHNFASGVPFSALQAASQRRFHFSFIGSIDEKRPDRELMIATFRARGLWNAPHSVPQYVKLLSRFYGSDMLDPTTYQAITRSSALVLCPFGNNPETHRFYEALALGSIPISRMQSQLNSTQLVLFVACIVRRKGGLHYLWSRCRFASADRRFVGSSRRPCACIATRPATTRCAASRSDAVVAAVQECSSTTRCRAHCKL
jgi:hypothetical protein